MNFCNEKIGIIFFDKPTAFNYIEDEFLFLLKTK